MYMYFHCFANTARLLRAYFSEITATERLHYKTIKYKKKLISLEHRVRAIKSHIRNSTNHFSGIM